MPTHTHTQEPTHNGVDPEPLHNVILLYASILYYYIVRTFTPPHCCIRGRLYLPI